METPLAEENRCPVCDSVVKPGATVCLMCGASLSPVDPQEPPEAKKTDEAPAAPAATPTAEPEEQPTFVSPAPAPPPVTTTSSETFPDVVESTMRERPSPIAVAMTALFFLVLIVIGSLVWRYQGDEISMVIAPSITPIPPTVTYTPTWTPLPTNTRPPTNTPTTSPTPAPTNTPRPARAHTVASGETLIGISLLYRVSPESIAQANNIAPDAAVQVNQSLLIPWPTPTPPLTMIAVEVNGETVIADPTDCERYQVQSGDSIVAIANRFGVQFDLLAQVNRIDDPSLLQPGDTVCIPQIIYGESLPPTPGPSPTPTETSPPPGPQLLYPLNEATIDPPDGVVTFQWAAVKDLTETEWYMVELSNADDLDGQAWRGFTRDNSFQAPSHWRPDAPETRRMRWRVSIVNVTGERSDGLPIYTYGGESSQDAYFYWLGAVPTATPTQTVTPTVVPES